MLNKAFKETIRQAHKTAGAYDADQAMELGFALGSSTAADYFKAKPKNFDPASDWINAIGALKKILATVAITDRGEAVRLAQVAARYAATYSEQENGSVSGRHLDSWHPIISSLYKEAKSFTHDITAHFDASRIVVEGTQLSFGYSLERISPTAKQWEQVLSSLFYFARRGKNINRGYDISADHWNTAVNLAPREVATREVERAQIVVSRKPQRDRFVNTLVAGQINKRFTPV
jgi:hypothetical protein